ncbi:MAG: hypothetical protein QOG07_59, partial [Pseudonocardiales bacterium]|nr:hypothetical protein [Pseudonocardiales bacterium]
MSQHSASHAARDRASRRPRGIRNWSRRGKIASGIIGAIMAGSIAFAVTNWTVG